MVMEDVTYIACGTYSSMVLQESIFFFYFKKFFKNFSLSNRKRKKESKILFF